MIAIILEVVSPSFYIPVWKYLHLDKSSQNFMYSQRRILGCCDIQDTKDTLLNIITKHFILNVAAALDPSLILVHFCTT